MRRISLITARRPRPLALAVASLVSLCATTAIAAPAVAPAPAPASTTTTTTEVSAPAGTPVVVVNNTTVPAAAPVVVAAPVAAAPVIVAPIAAPAPVPIPGTLDLHLYPHAMAAPTAEERERSRKLTEQTRARSLRTAGWATFGGTYGFSALVGTIAIDSAYDDRVARYGAWMTVPVAGPFVAAFHSRSATGALLTTSLGVAQAAGLAMALVGGHRYRRTTRNMVIAAAPTRGGAHVGVSMRF